MSIQIVKIKRALTQAVGAPNRCGRFRCPSHGGHDFNLALRDTARKVQMKCFSHDCSAKSILESIDLRVSDMYYNKGNSYSKYKKYDKSEYITPEIKDRLTPDELNHEIAIIERHAKDLEDYHIELNAFDGYRVRVAKARLLRHYTNKFGDYQ